MNDPRLRKTNTYTTITHIQNTLVRMRSPPTRSVVFTVHTHAHTHPHLFACAHPHPRALRSDAQTCSHTTHTYTFSQNGFMIFLGFGAFAGITMIVLLVMDVLECFLHALRLQWVEFMNVR